MKRITMTMNRLTTTIKIPPDGTFRKYSDEERKELKRIGGVSQKEIYRRLQAYEDTGLTPEGIEGLLAHVARLYKLIDNMEAILQEGETNSNS